MTSSVPSVEDFTNAFPTQLTPIVGKPTYTTLKTLKDQLKANAASVPTTLSGGNHGYLGLILSPAAYAKISNCFHRTRLSWTTPRHPYRHQCCQHKCHYPPSHRRHSTMAQVQKRLYRSQEPTSQRRRRHLRPSPSRSSCWLHESINPHPPHASFRKLRQHHPTRIRRQ